MPALQLILRRGLNGCHLIEVELPQNRLSYAATDVTDLKIDQN